MAVAEEQIMIYKQLSLNDTYATDPIIDTDGRLYKKHGSDGLWWKTTYGDINLAERKPEYIKKVNAKIVIGDGDVVIKNVTIKDGIVHNLKTNDFHIGDNSVKIVDNNIVVNDKPAYNNGLKFKTSVDIDNGDLICMDLIEPGYIVKGIGGKIENTNISAGGVDYTAIYKYSGDDDLFVLVYTEKDTSSITTNILIINKHSYDIIKKYSNTQLVKHSKLHYVVQVSDMCYTLVYCYDNVVKMISMNNVFDAVTVESHEICTDAACDNMCVKYDAGYLIVYYNILAQEFRAILVNGDFSINIRDRVLCNVYIQNNGKLQLIDIPGGTWIVSMGYVKFALLVSAGYLRNGDPVIDYNSVECIDMIYDQNYSLVMSMEKTISESFYVQAWDVSGLTMQKITNVTFGNVNVAPVGISSNTNNYTALYMCDDKIYVHLFDFDGKIMTTGLRYGCHKKSDTSSRIFSIEGTNKFIFYSGELTTFIANYQGVPAGYIGIAAESAKEGDLCEVTIKGHIYYNKNAMPASWIGRKLYITETDKPYPYYMSISSVNGIFMGTCLDRYRIILGL